MRLINEILVDINKAKAKVTSVELEIGKTTGVSSQINHLIQAENLLTYCHSRLSDIDPESLRPQSEWVEVDDGVSIGDGKHLECKNCGRWKKDRQRSNYCPNCGARMKGAGDHDR